MMIVIIIEFYYFVTGGHFIAKAIIVRVAIIAAIKVATNNSYSHYVIGHCSLNVIIIKRDSGVEAVSDEAIVDFTINEC